MPSDANTPVPKGKSNWIPWLFVAFFVVVFAVNGVMIALAVDTKPDLVTDRPYDRGVALALEQTRDRTPLSGEGDISLDPATRTLSINLSVSHQDSRRLDDPKAHVVMELPSRYAQVLRMDLEQVSPGVFEGTRDLPQGGDWTVTLIAEDGERRFRAAQTLTVE